VVPNRGLTEKDSDYAVAFAIPIDTKGVTFINVAKAPGRQTKMECPISRQYAFSDAMIILDDVFVPWERVFLCGEWQFGGGMGALFGHFHRLSHCGCIPGRSELLVGVTSLMAKYNGIGDKAHVRSKLVDLITHGEMVYACGIAASLKGTPTPSGIYQPASLYSNAGKLYESENTTSDIGILADVCGGMLVTMPSEADYFSSETGRYMKKYLKGAVDAEDRIKLFHLAADFCTTRWGANMGVGEVIGAGTPEAQRLAIYGGYDFSKPEALAKRLADISD
jgi:4-hydroxyphenylacetate 3-monooxygenase/4-hydroxybutyryl-CoA dehydratase/vinylacetyl-CoA-Delta-isomerase